MLNPMRDKNVKNTRTVDIWRPKAHVTPAIPRLHDKNDPASIGQKADWAGYYCTHEIPVTRKTTHPHPAIFRADSRHESESASKRRAMLLWKHLDEHLPNPPFPCGVWSHVRTFGSEVHADVCYPARHLVPGIYSYGKRLALQGAITPSVADPCSKKADPKPRCFGQLIPGINLVHCFYCCCVRQFSCFYRALNQVRSASLCFCSR